MSFNPDPTKQTIEMLFSLKRNHQPQSPFFFNNLPVVSASTQNNSPYCQRLFSKHLSEKIANARKGIGIVRHLSSPCSSEYS